MLPSCRPTTPLPRYRHFPDPVAMQRLRPRRRRRRCRPAPAGAVAGERLALHQHRRTPPGAGHRRSRPERRRIAAVLRAARHHRWARWRSAPSSTAGAASSCPAGTDPIAIAAAMNPAMSSLGGAAPASEHSSPARTCWSSAPPATPAGWRSRSPDSSARRRIVAAGRNAERLADAAALGADRQRARSTGETDAMTASSGERPPRSTWSSTTCGASRRGRVRDRGHRARRPRPAAHLDRRWDRSPGRAARSLRPRCGPPGCRSSASGPARFGVDHWHDKCPVHEIRRDCCARASRPCRPVRVRGGWNRRRPAGDAAGGPRTGVVHHATRNAVRALADERGLRPRRRAGARLRGRCRSGSTPPSGDRVCAAGPQGHAAPVPRMRSSWRSAARRDGAPRATGSSSARTP